ncbi:MAG: DUF342 domain-containing protein [Chitinispirillaceae bacterium]|nr:DUF342 domain-containing protein [Chitinispirillaceae bacterium]
MPADNEKKEDDKLAARIEKQLAEIETGEILRDMTKESLEEKGFIGDNSVALPGKISRRETEKEHLLFEADVDYERLPDDTVVEKLDAEPLLHLKEVKRGQLLAARKENDSVPFSCGINVALKITEKRELYYATAAGKAVIIKNRLHVIPPDRDCSLKIRIDDAKLNAFIDCIPGLGAGKALTPDLIIKELKNKGVVYGIDNDAILKATDESESTKRTLTDIRAAAGCEPGRGEDGRIEFNFDPEGKEDDFRILPDGRIDYHTSKNIIMAEKDQLLAQVVRPTPGKPGINVFCEEIPGESGIPASLIPGDGVRKSDDGTQLFADSAGSVIINGSLIEVVNTYIVNGDVDYSTGNIIFNGNVLINGNVPDGFEVKAEGDIIVAKIVESARLEAGRDIVIKGGVQGKGKGLISAGRDIRTGYAQNARLEAQGTIYIDNFTINSYIFTSRYLVMKKKRGSVIGGEIFAQRGIDVKVLGSETGVKTFVEAGTNYLIMRKISELDETIDFCEKNVAKIESSLKELHTRIKEGQKLDEGLKQVVSKALEKKDEIEQQRSVMLSRRSDLQAQSRENETCYVKISQTCYQDVFIKIKEYKTLVTKPRGNVRFFEDRKNGQLAAGAY